MTRARWLIERKLFAWLLRSVPTCDLQTALEGREGIEVLMVAPAVEAWLSRRAGTEIERIEIPAPATVTINID